MIKFGMSSSLLAQPKLMDPRFIKGAPRCCAFHPPEKVPAPRPKSFLGRVKTASLFPVESNQTSLPWRRAGKDHFAFLSTAEEPASDGAGFWLCIYIIGTPKKKLPWRITS